jgi:hypothetical protein
MKRWRGAYRILAENRRVRRPLGRLTSRWEVNVITDLQEVGWERKAWIGLIWFRIGRDGGLL